MKRTCAILMTLVLLMLCSCPVQAEDGLPDAPGNLTQTQQELLASLYEPLMRWEPAIRQPAHTEDADLAAVFIELICNYPEMSHVIGYSEQYFPDNDSYWIIPDYDSYWIIPDYAPSDAETKAMREKMYERGELEGLPYAPETIISVRNLTQTQRELMAYLYEHLMRGETAFLWPAHAKDTDLAAAFCELISNYPEVFHVIGYSGQFDPDPDSDRIWIVPDYAMSDAEAKAAREKMYDRVETILRQSRDPRYIHDVLVATVNYSQEALAAYHADAPAEDDAAYRPYYYANGALLQKHAVCQGYAHALCLLYRMAGIPCGVISGIGNASGVRHAWNIAWIDGRYTLIDATWNDYMLVTADGSSFKIVGHQYYGLSTAQMAADHTNDVDLTVPLCESLDK